ncbi:hypothetical protein [Tenacibaculum aquimarinum]|uniref:hypothetical protein n=1 Tax=Tenacibaculum aquimarinum TaxID=2910675 RepID=UPI001F0AF148|nr:hypothetical protein [Tenacibaculum aquimarinum]MCH3881689.1 hypothetical protein [Tenacibaculum aquimarinum]
MKIKNWNKTGKIKSLLIITFSLLSLTFLSFNESRELRNEFYIGISFLLFLFIIIFFPLVTKFWSLFGIDFEIPNWNENPLSLNFSKSLIFHQFIAYLLIAKGIITVLYVGIFYQQFEGENALFFIVGISILIGIKLSLKWVNKSRNGKEKTVANTV